MKSLRLIGLTTVFLAAFAVSTTARAGAWIEVGDAGDISDPQATVGVGNLTNISGTIGGSDTADAFGFQHTDPGGIFFIGATLGSGTGPT